MEGEQKEQKGGAQASPPFFCPLLSLPSML